ncbi:MAG: hypothetical protein HYY50_03455 [Candidatus Kerfeldbacteria bacterium]|nr:hypothetical protein [Candidatus Kerfeldbacteria bacterium]
MSRPVSRRKHTECPACIKDFEGQDRELTPASPTLLAAAALFSALTGIVGFILAMGFLTGSWKAGPSTLIFWWLGGTVALTSIIMCISFGHEVFSLRRHFVFLDHRLKIHIHVRDPRKELLQSGGYGWYRYDPNPSPASAPCINGGILLFWNGGYLWKYIYLLAWIAVFPYRILVVSIIDTISGRKGKREFSIWGQAVAAPDGRRTAWYIPPDSSIWSARLFHRGTEVVCPLEEALLMVNRDQGPKRAIVDLRRTKAERDQLGAVAAATVAYFERMRKRGNESRIANRGGDFLRLGLLNARRTLRQRWEHEAATTLDELEHPILPAPIDSGQPQVDHAASAAAVTT